MDVHPRFLLVAVYDRQFLHVSEAPWVRRNPGGALLDEPHIQDLLDFFEFRRSHHLAVRASAFVANICEYWAKTYMGGVPDLRWLDLRWIRLYDGFRDNARSLSAALISLLLSLATPAVTVFRCCELQASQSCDH
ncbi:hypothetical protein M514_22777 [Trichuris suis]|uniref:Uncharacterized protein n=1 Tax=Trichuris suis TaxID=68888 RepID=A0A085N6G4_9BILA|nr:hypothetical protein M514_22777 [Trichuris suis]